MIHDRLLMAFSISLGICVPAFGQAKRPPPPIKVAPVISKTVTNQQSYVGTVMPTRRSVIGSAVDGRVKTFPANEGDRVETGAVLAELRDRTISLELAARRAEWKAAFWTWMELEAGTRWQELEQAVSRYKAAEALHEFTNSRRQRYAELIARGSVTKDEQQEIVSTADVAAQRFAEAAAALKLAKEGPREEQKAQAAARVEALQAECDRLADQKERHVMRSPFAGYVVAEHTEQGAWVQRGDPIATVIELDHVDIQVMVLEQHINQIHVGGTVEVKLSALPGRTLKGKVQLIVPDADVRSRSFPVKIRVKNEIKDGQPVLQSGMLARVSLNLVEANALMVPKDALVLSGEGAYVMVAELLETDDQKNLANAVPVTVAKGVTEGSLIQVISDRIKPRQLVVVVGNERLPGPGSKLAPAQVEIVNLSEIQR